MSNHLQLVVGGAGPEAREVGPDMVKRLVVSLSSHSISGFYWRLSQTTLQLNRIPSQCHMSLDKVVHHVHHYNTHLLHLTHSYLYLSYHCLSSLFHLPHLHHYHLSPIFHANWLSTQLKQLTLHHHTIHHSPKTLVFSESLHNHILLMPPLYLIIQCHLPPIAAYPCPCLKIMVVMPVALPITKMNQMLKKVRRSMRMSSITLEISPSDLVSYPKCLIQITLTCHIIIQHWLHLSLHLHTHLQLPLPFSHSQTLENQKF